MEKFLLLKSKFLDCRCPLGKMRTRVTRIICKEAGAKLRQVRIDLGLTLREVEERSALFAEEKGNLDCAVTDGQLSNIEKGKNLPSLFAISALTQIYQKSFEDILGWYRLLPEVSASLSNVNSASSWLRTGANVCGLFLSKSSGKVCTARVRNLKAEIFQHMDQSRMAIWRSNCRFEYGVRESFLKADAS